MTPNYFASLLLLSCLFAMQLLHAQTAETGSTTALQPYHFTQPKMGSPFVLTIYANDSLQAASAAAAAFKQVDSLNTLFSDYLDSSELNRLSATAGQHRYVPVSPLLYDILQQSLTAARLSSGSFDITIGAVVKLWRKARKAKQLPDSLAMKQALQTTGYRYLHLDSVHHSVLLDKAGMQLDLGGIAKGYAAQYAVSFLKQQGFPFTMADAGGDLAMGNTPPGKKGWLIGINLPEQTDALLPNLLQVHNKAIATSGDVYQYILYKGKKYSHIINPKTGMGVTFQRNVTAVANDGATADWLATACSILPIPQAMQLIARIPGAALLITEERNGKLVQFPSPHFELLYERH